MGHDFLHMFYDCALLPVRGANVNYSNIHGVTALHEAVVRGDKGIVEELLKFGALSTIKATSGCDFIVVNS